jgi:hypothetical protein
MTLRPFRRLGLHVHDQFRDRERYLGASDQTLSGVPTERGQHAESYTMNQGLGAGNGGFMQSFSSTFQEIPSSGC